jgi:NAD(P)-dependent dehydrogenase (short-subunit alcohol dehydrogenase family)
VKLAYIGLGNLGEHIAMNLVKAGHEVAVFDLNEESGKALVAAGARWASSAADAVTGVDAAFTCLPSTKAIEAVFAEIIPAMPQGSTWIDNSTNDYDLVVDLGERPRAVLVEVRREVRALEKLHHEPRGTGLLDARGHHVDDVVALDASGDARLLLEALTNLGVARELRVEHLERARLRRAELLHHVHGAHAAPRERSHDLEVAREDRTRLQREHRARR